MFLCKEPIAIRSAVNSVLLRFAGQVQLSLGLTGNKLSSFSVWSEICSVQAYTMKGREGKSGIF